MSYESYEPYDEYDPNRPDQGGYPEQQQPYYDQQQYQQYQQPYEQQQPYPGGQQDQQWAQSGLGWEQQAWDETRLGTSPLQETEYQEYQQPEQGYGGYSYNQVNELSGTDFQQYQADLPGDLPVPDYPPEPDPPAGERRGRRGRAPQTPEVEEYAEYAAEPGSGFPHQRPEAADHADYADYADSPARPAPAAPNERPAATPGTAPPTAAGRGSFGAAGIGVVTAVAAVASSGALVIVVALIQFGVAYGWQQAVGARDGGRQDRRAMVLTALIGWAATAAADKLALNNEFLGIPVTLGLGFLLLAADQTMRRERSIGDGERVAGLGISVAGGLFAVLPAGFVVAERTDSALTAACASAAALGVLCCALLGRNPVRGILAGLVFGAGVGAFAAKALQADGGLQAGALGGAVAALAAATAVGALDRIVAEAEARGSTKIVSQALPVALAAVGALIASAVFR